MASKKVFTVQSETRVSELILSLHNELQQAVEHISKPEVRVRSPELPSEAFVIPNRISVRMPIEFTTKETVLTKATMNNLMKEFSVPVKPFLDISIDRSGTKEDMVKATIVNVRLPSEKATPQAFLGEINIEFLFSSKG